ncbi:hypothetical protein C3E77_02940 [Mycetocola zhujimingii]|nr:hypothetical protein C3E77_02940 [Mycetocola zhujimingii]
MESLTRDEGHNADLTRPFVDTLPVEGAAVSTLGPLFGTETISATNERAARLDELQFDLGEGPCWDALSTARPVLEPDVRNKPVRTWPAFSEALRQEEIGAIFAFPMLVGSLRLGAIDLYCTTPCALSAADAQRSVALAAVVSRLVLRQALDKFDRPDTHEPHNPFFRRTLHQATGMVLAQLNLSPDDARLVIQAHAFAAGRPVQEVAQDILARKLDLSTSTQPGRSHD